MAPEISGCGAYLAALLITGSAEGAEKAVSEAIATTGLEVEEGELRVATVRCAIPLVGEGLPYSTPSCLPAELQRLFWVPLRERLCFVLRMLMGLSREMSSEILNLRRDEVDEALCRAMSELPRFPAAAPKEAATHGI